MSLVRTLARPMLASPILLGGLDALRHPESTTEVSERAAKATASRIPGLSGLGPDAAVRVSGGVMLGAGTLLALGRLPRVASLAVAATLVPPLVDRVRSYRADPKSGDPAARADERRDLVRSAGVVGGLLLAVVDTSGRASLARRARYAGEHASTVAHSSARLARREVHHAAREAKLAARAAKP